MVLGRLDNHMQRNEIGPLSYTTHKKYLKNGLKVYVRPQSIKLLERKQEKVP